MTGKKIYKSASHEKQLVLMREYRQTPEGRKYTRSVVIFNAVLCACLIAVLALLAARLSHPEMRLDPQPMCLILCGLAAIVNACLSSRFHSKFYKWIERDDIDSGE